MIGKQVFLNQSVEVEIADILNEVTSYIDNLHKSRMLSPADYDHTLLFIAEILPYIKNQEAWISLGYMLCKDLKQNLEKYGFNRQIGMFGGLGYQCFAVNSFCKQANILEGFSHSINKVLFIAIGDILKRPKANPTYDSDYDVIGGVSGMLYYLLDYDCNKEEKQILVKCIEYLLEFARDTKFLNQTVINFHVLQPNQNPNFNQKDFKNGSINFGLAHGMLGPLIALAKSYEKGFVVNGLRDGIEKIYQLYERFQSVNEGKVPQWPGVITVEEYVEGICRPEHLHVHSSWCYGNIGIVRGLQKVAGYMDWKETEQAYIKAMKHLCSQKLEDFKLFRPSLCHGFSSLVAIQTCTYSAYVDSGLLCHLERNVRHLIALYRKSNEHDLSLVDIHDETNPVEGYLKDLSLLTGSTGVAIALLSLKGKIRIGKLLMID